MYCKLIARRDDPNFSYIIAKNPNGAPYERDIGYTEDARKVRGRYTEDGYEIEVANDGLAFLERMKEANEAAYVRAEVWIVCPGNLKGFAEAFRSAIYGKRGPIAEEVFFAPKELSAIIGPFPNFVPAAFEDVGLKAEHAPSETAPERLREACMLRVWSETPLSVTEFLQKIYIVSMALTMKYNWAGFIEEAQIDKFIALSASWLNKCPKRDRLIGQLSGFKKTLVTRFEAGLPKAEEPESLDEGLATVDPERQRSLHEQRHAWILRSIPPETKHIVDLGSSEGKLLAAILEKMPEAHVVGVEANRDKIARMRRRLKSKRLELLHDNLVHLHDPDRLVGAEVLVATEVIEHLEAQDRARFVEVMRDLIAPPLILLTTPNVDYNDKFNLAPGEYRHHDHRIEYTEAQLREEVITPLEKDYDVRLEKLLPEEDLQPSFLVIATRRAPRTTTTERHLRARREAARMGMPLYLDGAAETINPGALLEGYTSYPFLDNARQIFYLGPTMAPADYCDAAPDYLEHPEGCFKYYTERGVFRLVEEPKYMGSRGYIILFRQEEHARRLGFDSPIVVNSRSGSPFFKDPGQLAAIYEDVRGKLKDDVTILDAEILPWKLKADRLIARDFRLPGEAALLWRERCQPEGMRNAKRFLEVVDHFGNDGPLEVRAFHLLAAASLKTKQDGRVFFDRFRLGFFRSHRDQWIELRQLEGDIVKAVPLTHVNLDSPIDREEAVRRWKSFCQDGGEGFVYKPEMFLVRDESGYLRQPAMKVRGPDYLRIIYGMDYSRPEYLDRLKKRGTWAKRKLAIMEQELGVRILRAFVHHNTVERLRAIGAFLGIDEVRGRDIDKTL